MSSEVRNFEMCLCFLCWVLWTLNKPILKLVQRIIRWNLFHLYWLFIDWSEHIHYQMNQTKIKLALSTEYWIQIASVNEFESALSLPLNMYTVRWYVELKSLILTGILIYLGKFDNRSPIFKTINFEVCLSS